MTMQEKYINKFKELYKTRFGKEITSTEVLEKCLKLVRLVEIVLEPTPIHPEETEKDDAMGIHRRSK